MPKLTVNLVRPLAFAFAVLLLTGFALNQPVQAEPTVRTLLELGLKEDPVRPNKPPAGDIDIFPNIVHVGETVLVHGKLSQLNERGVKVGGVPDAPVKLVDIFNNAQNPIVLASGTSDEKGFLAIEWHVEAKKLFEELGESEVQEGIGSIEEIKLTVMAVYEGDDTYLPSTSLGYIIELRPLKLDVSVRTDKQVYAVGDVAGVTITIKDRAGNLVDPDSLSVIFKSMVLSHVKKDTGTYFLSTPELTENIHLITVIAEKEGYISEARSATITVSAEVEMAVDIGATLDQRAYGVGDVVELAGSVRPALVERPVLLSITNPNGVVYNVGQITISEAGTFEHEFKLTGPLAVPGSWSIALTYLGEQIVKEFDAGVAQTKFMRVALESPETVDDLGDNTERGEVGRPLGIQTELINTEQKDIRMAYIVKVTDADGVTIMVSWIKIDTLRAGESLKPAIFWIPESTGEYMIDIFLWDSLNNPIPLSTPARIDVRVV